MKHLLTVPKVATGFRFALIPVLIILFSIKQNTTVEMLSFAVFTIAALTGLIDGRLAGK